MLNFLIKAEWSFSICRKIYQDYADTEHSTQGVEHAGFIIMSGTSKAPLSQVLLLLWAKQYQDVPSTSPGSVSKWKLHSKTIQGWKCQSWHFVIHMKKRIKYSTSVAFSLLKMKVVLPFLRVLQGLFISRWKKDKNQATLVWLVLSKLTSILHRWFIFRARLRGV